MIACGDVIETVLHRVRDPHGTAHDRELVRKLLNYTQLMVNSNLGLVTAERAHTLKPMQQVYGLISELYPEVGRIKSIHFGGYDLPEIEDWRRLWHYDRRWFRAIGPTPKVWAMLGRDSFIVHPGVRAATEVTIHYATVPTTLVVDTDTLEIPDQHLPMVYDMLELLLLTKGRGLSGEDKTILDSTFDRSLGRYAGDAQSRSPSASTRPIQPASRPESV